MDCMDEDEGKDDDHIGTALLRRTPCRHPNQLKTSFFRARTRSSTRHGYLLLALTSSYTCDWLRGCTPSMKNSRRNSLTTLPALASVSFYTAVPRLFPLLGTVWSMRRLTRGGRSTRLLRSPTYVRRAPHVHNCLRFLIVSRGCACSNLGSMHHGHCTRTTTRVLEF